MELRVNLTDAEATALAQMVKRFGLHHAKQLASEFTTYDGLPEHDMILEVIMKVQRALEARGCNPR